MVDKCQADTLKGSVSQSLRSYMSDHNKTPGDIAADLRLDKAEITDILDPSSDRIYLDTALKICTLVGCELRIQLTRRDHQVNSRSTRQQALDEFTEQCYREPFTMSEKSVRVIEAILSEKTA